MQFFTRRNLQIGDYECRTRSSTPDVLRPSAGSMNSGSVIGIGSGGMSLSLTAGGRTSLVSEEESIPDTYTLNNPMDQHQRDPQSPMVPILLRNLLLRMSCFGFARVLTCCHFSFTLDLLEIGLSQSCEYRLWAEFHVECLVWISLMFNFKVF